MSPPLRSPWAAVYCFMTVHQHMVASSGVRPDSNIVRLVCAELIERAPSTRSVSSQFVIGTANARIESYPPERFGTTGLAEISIVRITHSCVFTRHGRGPNRKTCCACISLLRPQPGHSPNFAERPLCPRTAVIFLARHSRLPHDLVHRLLRHAQGLRRFAQHPRT